jgi:hypothetical protein
MSTFMLVVSNRMSLVIVETTANSPSKSISVMLMTLARVLLVEDETHIQRPNITMLRIVEMIE